MTLKKTIVLIILAVSTNFVIAQELLKTTKTWEGGTIVYPKGKAEITSLKFRIQEGETSKFHCHPVPTLGYILKGTVEIETKTGKKILLKEGDSAVEVMKTVHRGKAIDGSVEIIVFYAGAKDMPTTVLPENDPAFKYCNK